MAKAFTFTFPYYCREHGPQTGGTACYWHCNLLCNDCKRPTYVCHGKC